MRKSGKIVKCMDGYLVYLTETQFSFNKQDAIEWLKSEGVKEEAINTKYGMEDKNERRTDPESDSTDA